jgi:N-formylglutamate amidohydrolase
MGARVKLAQVHRGDSPLVIDVPHAGTFVPDAIGARLTPAARALADTDWHVDRLYAFAPGVGATLLVATHSRYVVDLNRDPSGRPLYPGADNSELCPLRTFADEPVYAEDGVPDDTEVDARKVAYFAPYHAALAAELERARQRHGFAVLLDGHSIRSQVPRFFAGRLPDLNLGTARGASCGADLEALATDVLGSDARFTSVVNGRFTGGYVTRHYGQPHEGVHALQLEMAQACYMDESPPYRFESARAAPLSALLQRLVDALQSWRPTPRPDTRP